MFSVAFEGCACRAAFHIGVARCWHEQGLRPHIIAGASSGSLVAAAWASNALEALEDRWLALVHQTRPFDLQMLRRGRWPGRMSHILRDGLQADHGDLRMQDLPSLRIAVTRLGLRGPRVRLLDFTCQLSVVDAILGSCFIPGPYSRPVWLQRRFAVDGAWLERVPIDALPTGRRVAVVTNPQGELRAGLLRVRTLSAPDDVRTLHPEHELRAVGFVFDRPAAVEGIAAGRRAAEQFLRAYEGWLGL